MNSNRDTRAIVIILHIVLSLVSCGLWIPVWILMEVCTPKQHPALAAAATPVIVIQQPSADGAWVSGRWIPSPEKIEQGLRDGMMWIPAEQRWAPISTTN